MKANENEILTIAGKRVRVEYCKPGEDCCARCCFSFGGGETCVGLDGGEEWPCEKFDLATAYFVEAEQPQEKDYKKLYEGLVNSEWYKKYYQGASVGDSVAVEQPEADLEAEIERKYKADATTMKTRDQYATLASHFAEWERERMMKEAVEGMVEYVNGFATLENVVLHPADFKNGEKVSVIIIKKEK